jgi:CheY-like chemotaxis protein
MVRSGKGALRAMLKGDFAVVLLDVRMPGMDGFETAALMREREKSAHLPIIFVTAADHSETHIARGYSLGAVDYIYTPIVPEILRAKVAVFVELKLQRERMRRLEQREHERQLDEARDRLEVERNRFLSLAGPALHCQLGRPLPSSEPQLGANARVHPFKPHVSILSGATTSPRKQRSQRWYGGPQFSHGPDRSWCRAQHTDLLQMNRC